MDCPCCNVDGVTLYLRPDGFIGCASEHLFSMRYASGPDFLRAIEVARAPDGTPVGRLFLVVPEDEIFEMTPPEIVPQE